jgi:Zn-dependent M28 family amino/carboxypeptidase
VKYSIEDDHLPFIEAGIPSVDIIDIDYRYYHTTSDLPEHVTAKSLQIVGDVLWTWITEQSQ